jgi:hypothetical protein
MKDRFFGKSNTPTPPEPSGEDHHGSPINIPAIFPTNIQELAHSAKRARDLIGENPEFINLRDHKELDGKDILIVGIGSGAGEFGQYVKIYGIILDENKNPVDKKIIMTGAENVVERCLDISATVPNLTQNPVIATLRIAGDAWLLD